MKKIIRIMGSSSSMKSQLRGQLKYLSKEFEVLAIASGKQSLQQIEQREGIRTCNLIIAREINILQDLKSLLYLISIFYQEKPDIVHVSSPKAALLSMFASYICRVPNRVYTVTGLRFETTTGWLRKLLIFTEKICCFCATKVIPEGYGVKKTLSENKITCKELEVILHGNMNGVDVNYFSRKSIVKSKDEIRRELKIERNSFVFVFIGRLVEDKGVNELITAFEKLESEKPCNLILLGELEKINEISERSKKSIYNNKRIKYLGYKEDIRPYLKAADVFVLPSYREGFPNVVLQACAMEVPSIVTDISGSNEIIDNNSGIVIPTKDSLSLYNAMKMLMFDFTQETLANMGKYARENVKIKFEQKKVWSALLSEYKNMIS